MLEDLKGKRALVTGASTGIGAAVAKELGRLGVAVAVHGNKNAAAVEAVAKAIRDAGGTAVVTLGDVSTTEVSERIVAEAVAGLGGLDILINNAGALIDRLANADWEDGLYEAVYDTNVRSVFAVTKAAYPHLKASGDAAIVNTGSIAGRMGGGPGSVIYASAKAAVHSITRNQAREFAPDGIRANVVAPGFITTPFHDATPEPFIKAAEAQTAMKRLGTAEECVGAFIFLCSSTMSGYITGQIIDVNGGQLTI